MILSEEQVFIVYSVSDTSQTRVGEVLEAVRSYQRPSYVPSVVAKPYLFPIPSASDAGASLGSDLYRQLTRSIGAIVFVDALRPNIAYELGVFHGQGRPVLLITEQGPDRLWKELSDLAGSALLDLRRESLKTGVQAYLTALYDSLQFAERVEAPELPFKKDNMLSQIVSGARIPVDVTESDFGSAVLIRTWGGVVFDLGYDLLPEAKVKLALRRPSARPADYSVYFRIGYTTFMGQTRGMYLGMTSLRSTAGIESNERNLPSQGLSSNWRLLFVSFADLLRRGSVLDIRRINRLELMRVRAGSWREDPLEETTPWELGFVQIVGIDR